jgi:Tfp pilus assembly protein PilP
MRASALLMAGACAIATTAVAAQKPAQPPQQAAPQAATSKPAAPSAPQSAPVKPVAQTAPQPAPVKPAAQTAPQPVPAKPAPAAPAAAAPPATPAPGPVEPQSTYTYQREGRRDPFLNLIGGGAETRGVISRRGEGPAGMAVAEISVRGVVQSRGELVAMVHGPDNHTYLVHQGDKFADGVIKTITPQGLVIVQEVNDPLSLIKQREVRKLLRSLEDGKE